MTEIPPPPPSFAGSAEVPPAGKGLAITSLVLGIVSIAVCCYWFISGPLGVAALITGILARKRPAGKGMALTGIITGAIGIVLAIVAAILTFSGNIDSFCVSNPDNPYCEAQY